MKKTPPPYAHDLAAIRHARSRAGRQRLPSTPPEQLQLNPSLELVPVNWRGLGDLEQSTPQLPTPGAGFILCWRQVAENSVQCRYAEPNDLLAIKLVSEGLDPAAVAAAGSVPLATVIACLHQAVSEGLLLAPPSRIRRDPPAFDPTGRYRESLLVADTFTLQWHITQECDLHCRHCYDRSVRQAVTRTDGFRILDQLQAFCAERRVVGQVSFSGGNPLLHPDFLAFYRGAGERGLQSAILGNPASRQDLEAVLAIGKPAYFQVSLEGLAEQNDAIRGPGHYQRTMQFLELLRELEIPSQVMLTLTRENLAQVIPLGRALQGLAGSLAFNRLALFGEGAALALPERDIYRQFLDAYRLATKELPVLALKDNLLNLAYDACGEEPFCGCAGYGCGAAFNFVALLADGEVHACRKFPSPIGTIQQQSLASIYDSAAAARYRAGSSACAGCHLRAVCGGCLAITASYGLDPLTNRDPFCFRT